MSKTPSESDPPPTSAESPTPQDAAAPRAGREKPNIVKVKGLTIIGNMVMGFYDAVGGTNNTDILMNQMLEIEMLFDHKGMLRTDITDAATKLEEATAWLELDLQRYRETRDAVADAVCDTVTIVTGIVLAVLPGTNALGAALLAFAFALMASAAKAAIKGGGYTLEEAKKGW